MHILITTPAFPPFIGGGERHTGTLARQLLLRGHQVSVLTSLAKKESDFWNGALGKVSFESEQPGLTVIRVPLKKLPLGWQGLLFWRKVMVLLSPLPGTTGLLQHMSQWVPPLMDTNHALEAVTKPLHVVHAFNISWEHAMLVALRFAQANQIPFIASPLAHLGEGPGDRIARNSTMRHQRALLEAADMLITNTGQEAQGLKDMGIKVKDFRVAGPGVDVPQTVDPFPEANKTQKPFILFVGRSNVEKGAVHAAQAVLKLRKDGSDINLVMIGQRTAAFERYYDSLTAVEQDGIHHLGLVQESLKHAYLKEARALLLPSRTDSFGIVILESWLYARPVIGADAGGIPAVIDDGQNGILVPYGDINALASAVKLLLDDGQLNHQMGEKGYKKLMAKFTWQSVTDVVEDAYQAAIDSYSN